MKKFTNLLMSGLFAVILLLGTVNKLNAQTELLSNNGFDDGLNNWELWESGTTHGELTLDESSKIEGANSAHIKITDGGGEGWTLGFAQGITGGVKAGKKYVIRYKAVASEAVTIHQMVQQADSPWGAIHTTELALTTDVQALADTFEVTEDANCNFVFQIGDIGTAEIWLDEIYLTEIEGAPEPNPGELLLNNGFDDGLNNWELWESGATHGELTLDETSKIDGANSAHLKITNGGGEAWTLGFAQGINGGVKAGKKYIIKYKAVASEAVTIHQMVQQADSPWGAIHATELGLTTEVQALVDTFDITEDANCNFVFQIGDIGTAEIWLDEIHLIEINGSGPDPDPTPDPGEQLKNNYFNHAMDNWNLWQSGQTHGDAIIDGSGKLEGANSAHLNITDGGGEAWTLGFAQGIDSGVVATCTYVVKFMVVGSEATHVNAMVQQADSPWGAIYEKNVEVGTEPVTVVDTFTVANSENCNFVFQYGDIGSAELWVDDVHLIKISGPDGIKEKKYTGLTLEQNYPNPFVNSTTIAFSLKKTGKVTVGVYNMKGELVSLINNKIYTAGEHKVSINMADFPSGIYYGRITNSIGSETIKMVLIR